jgi:hypothetical protein
MLSVIIWSTPVTALQMFGYAIALAGLIYYKVGGDQAQAAYAKLTGDENSLFNRIRRSLWAKIGVVVLLIFILVAMARGFSGGNGYDMASTKTGLTGVPDPEMVDAYHHGDLENWEPGSTPTHYTDESYDEIPSSHPLDVVIFVSPSSDNATFVSFQHILSLPSISALNPHVIVYGDASSSPFPVAKEIPLGTFTSASAAYLDFISNSYDALASHTLFLHTDVDVQHIQATVAARFTSKTGVAELSQGGYSVCTCMDCVDTKTHASLTKTAELYALTNQNICSSSDRLLVTHSIEKLTKIVE